VHAALASAHPPFGGSLSDSSVRFLDTVLVRRGPAAWDGDETVRLWGGPFPDDLLVLRTSDSLRFVAVGRPGRYPLTIENEGYGPARAALRILAFSYAAHMPATAPNLAVRPFPMRLFFALGDSVSGDTVEFFKMAPPAGALPVTATVQWDTPANVDLVWRTCAAPSPAGNFDGATGAKPERTSVIIPAGACWLLGAHLVGAPTTATVLGRLILTSP
jgi:hypothetical protein